MKNTIEGNNSNFYTSLIPADEGHNIGKKQLNYISTMAADNKNQVGMTRKCHNHRPPINPRQHRKLALINREYKVSVF